MLHAPRWLLVTLGAALGCSPLVAITTEPGGSCSDDDVAHVFGLGLYGHAPLLRDDYPGQLCDWNGAILRAGERRRMGRDTSHYDVGDAWVDRGEPERAIAAFRRDYERATTPMARVADRVEIAKLLSEAGDHEAALRELDACAEELDGQRSSRVEDARVDVLVAMDRRREAIAVLEARPPSDRWATNATTQIQIADLWLEEGEPARAKPVYAAALASCEERCEKFDEVHDARVGLVRVLQAQGHPRAALAALERELEDLDPNLWWPNHAKAWRLRAALELELDNPWSAAASVRRAFEIEHEYREPSELARASSRSELAGLHLRADRPDLAFAGFHAAYRVYVRALGPIDLRTRIAAHNLGVACLVLDDPEQAIPWLKLAATAHEAAASDPYHRGLTHLNLGRAEQRSGLHAEAAGSFAIAVDLLGELDDPRFDDRARARMVRDAVRAFLDVGMCDRALATYAKLGDDQSLVDLTGTRCGPD